MLRRAEEDRALLEALDFHKHIRSALLEAQAADVSHPAAAAAAQSAIAAMHENSSAAPAHASERALLEFRERAWFDQALHLQASSNSGWSPEHRAPPRPRTALPQPTRLQLESEQQTQRALRHERRELLRREKLKQEQQRLRARVATASQPCLLGSGPVVYPLPRVSRPGSSTPARLVPELVLRRVRSQQALEHGRTMPELFDSRELGQRVSSKPPTAMLPSASTAEKARKLHRRVSVYLSIR